MITEDRPSGAQIARRAWSSVFCATRQMPALAISALIALMALATGLGCLRLLAAANVTLNVRSHSHIAMFGLGWLQSVLTISATSVIAAPIAVAMHRFILLGEVSRSPVSIASGRTLKFFLWVASIQLIISTINEISTWLFVSNYLPFHSLAEFGLVMLAVAVPLGAATIYLALLFPALAIDEPAVDARARISTSMTRMQGHFWQFVGAILLTCAPITILGAVTNAFIGELLAARMTRPVVQGLIAGKRLLWLFQMQDGWFYVEHFLRALVTVLTVALAASVASWHYASILKGPKRNDT